MQQLLLNSSTCKKIFAVLGDSMLVEPAGRAENKLTGRNKPTGQKSHEGHAAEHFWGGTTCPGAWKLWQDRSHTISHHMKSWHW
jgi:hypothetical protein